MAKSLQDLIKAQNDAISTLNAARSRLVTLRMGAPPPDRADITLQIVGIDADLNEAQKVKAHLTAANTVVQPMSPQVEAELNTLANKLDQAILSSAILNAALDTVVDFIDTAMRVSQIVDGST